MRINKNVVLLSTRLNNFKFNLNRGKGHLWNYMMDRFRWHFYPRIHHVSKFPTHVDLELSNACNLSCSMCYTTTDKFKKIVSKSIMEKELFKKVIDECAEYDSHYSIRLSWRGEPFLHPDIMELIKYAKDKGIKEVSTLTHGGFLTPEKFEELVDLELDWLTISFDGVDETYEQIRAPLKYEESVAKIKEYHEIKKRKKSVKPVIKIQGVWPAVAKNPEKFFNTFQPIVDQVASPPLLDYLHMDTEIEYIEDFTCPVLYQRLTVASSGKAYMCFNDELQTNEIGDLHNESVYEIWHGKKMKRVRDIHLKHEGYKELPSCKFCFYPRKTTKIKTKINGRDVTLDPVTHRPQEVGK